MMGGRRYVPAVASHVRPHVNAITPTTLQRTADCARPGKIGCAGLETLSKAYASKAAENPTCQNIKSHEPDWIFAPRSPVGENAPLKVSACGTTMNAVKRYPFARARIGREPEIANCENNSTAVTRSVTKTIASRSGKKMFSVPNGILANGATIIKATNTIAATPAADQV